MREIMPAAHSADNSPGDVLLAIETTCDETAAAVIDRSLRVHSSVVASQDDLHGVFGGIVPEIASRAHVRRILPVIDQALTQAGRTLDDLSAVAVAARPGLVGSLLVGLTAAKTLAAVLEIPLLAVDHIAAHIFACRMAAGRDVFPALGFVVSGGHTNLYDCRNATEMRLIGSTLDDAAGEAFDKVAKILSLGYPGGPSVERAAAGGNAQSLTLPRPMLEDERLDFSFSGLKTAVLYAVRGTPSRPRPNPRLSTREVADIAAAFQEAVVDVLVGKCRQALRIHQRRRLCVGGGVAANGRFRQRLLQLGREMNVEVLIAPPPLCTDNAAMAGIAWEMLAAGQVADLDADVIPGLVRKRGQARAVTVGDRRLPEHRDCPWDFRC